MYVIYLTILPLPHWTFPVSPICYLHGISNKDTRFRGGKKKAEKISKSRLRDTAHRLVYEPFQTDCPGLHATWGQKTNSLKRAWPASPRVGGCGTHHREDYLYGSGAENQHFSSMENLAVWNNLFPVGSGSQNFFSEELSLQSICTECLSHRHGQYTSKPLASWPCVVSQWSFHPPLFLPYSCTFGCILCLPQLAFT